MSSERQLILIFDKPLGIKSPTEFEKIRLIERRNSLLGDLELLEINPGHFYQDIGNYGVFSSDSVDHMEVVQGPPALPGNPISPLQIYIFGRSNIARFIESSIEPLSLYN